MSMIELSRRMLSAAIPGAAGRIGRCLVAVGLLAAAAAALAVAGVQHMEASHTVSSTVVKSSRPTGHWTGYWSWRWNGTGYSWVWTWVWVWDEPGWHPS